MSSEPSVGTSHSPSDPVRRPADGDGSGIAFSGSGVVAGARAIAPIAIGGGAFGVVFGVLAGSSGLSSVETALMSMLVFAGVSQFVALDLWTDAALPIAAIVATTLIVNLRHILMGASLRPVLGQARSRPIYLSLFFMTDETWAMTVSAFGKGMSDAGFLLGAGLGFYLAWVAGTIFGRSVGALVQDPSALAPDFAFTAMFLALLVSLRRGRRDLLPWATAAVVAAVSGYLLPGNWYILFGALAGSTVGAWRDGH